jgi:hypothetical protein
MFSDYDFGDSIKSAVLAVFIAGVLLGGGCAGCVYLAQKHVEVDVTLDVK